MIHQTSLNHDVSVKGQCYQAFGEQAFAHGLFYRHEQSLRFELSAGGTFVDMINQALTKSMQILDFTFQDCNDLYACLSVYGKKGLLNHLSVFRQLNNLNIHLDKSTCEIWQEQCPIDDEFPDDDFYRTFIIFPITLEIRQKLLWSAIAQDFNNIEPKVNASVYLFSLKLEILAHPYDDRGMDIIGNNFTLKQKLFSTFNHYLLDYDRDEMNKYYQP